MAKKAQPTTEPTPKRATYQPPVSGRIELSVRSSVVAPAAQTHADRRVKDDARQLKQQLREDD